MADFLPVVIGGGPAGITVAHALSEKQVPSVVLEKDKQIGGLCKTVQYNGFRCDIGGHRFFTKNKQIQNIWENILDGEFMTRPRLSRIYYQGKFFNYPLRAGNALAGLGLVNSSRVIFSYLKSQLFPVNPEISFEDWVSNRFGQKLYNIFFKTYTEKVWGISCKELSADWAAQRIRNLSLGRAVLHALGVGKGAKVASLIERFHYPRLGPGQMFETMVERAARHGAEIRMNHNTVEVQHVKNQVTGVKVQTQGNGISIPCSHCFSSMPLNELVLKMQPLAPDAVLDAARALRYRSLITVNLLFKKTTPLPDNWIYIHSPEVQAGRLQFYANWSPYMVPSGGFSSVGFEYFCFEDDSLWNLSDGELIKIALQDLACLGFYHEQDYLDGFVVRYSKAYPMYENNYMEHLKVIRDWLSRFGNLYCIGRYGQFRYNNMDHSMMTGLLAVRRMLGEEVDPWSVNAEGEYLEEKAT
ncbi:MAG: NAD(P)/FAD-dependent oxidoreductase [Deltaproteobacteria bacterium]|nr:NAD(P)/FAD-dependent oxidoreductase [Deltaproteobacteria bacterium]